MFRWDFLNGFSRLFDLGFQLLHRSNLENFRKVGNLLANLLARFLGKFCQHCRNPLTKPAKFLSNSGGCCRPWWPPRKLGPLQFLRPENRVSPYKMKRLDLSYRACSAFPSCWIFSFRPEMSSTTLVTSAKSSSRCASRPSRRDWKKGRKGQRENILRRQVLQ